MTWTGPEEEATCQEINKATAKWVMDTWGETDEKNRFM
jgi:hypothetical protein